jgi:hypothetical protein
MGQHETRAAPAAGVPTAAAVLGYAGAIPFVTLALATFVSGAAGPLAIQAVYAYAVAILSFLGGVHWGVALTTRGEPTFARLGAGVVPSLAGWAAFLVGGRAGLWLLAASFAAVLAYDLRQTRAGVTPGWYPRLRWPLTLAVIGSLLLASVNAA